MAMLRIGVDVGGTNTDAVVMREARVVSWAKRPTTSDVTTGIIESVREALAASGTAPRTVAAVMVGTTHFTNAVVQRRDLAPVAVFRLCGPATHSLPPFVDWPPDLRREVEGFTALLPGGLEYDGRPLVDLDEAALRQACRVARRKGLRHVAVSCVFSPVNGEQERRAREIIREEIPEATVSLSHEIGRLGLLERENAAILNACLQDLGVRTVRAFQEALRGLGLTCPLYLTQNDGTLMGAAFAGRFPVYTFASGPTNSMRGAAFLSGVREGVVVDIGGTTTDVGALVHGFPREAVVEVEVGGVRTNFRMPDVQSIGLGGGSLVRFEDGRPRVGPDSVGRRLLEEGLVFGGQVLTATDVAVAGGLLRLGDPSRVAHLEPARVQAVLAEIQRRVEEAVDRARTRREPVPVILVGGGSVLVRGEIQGASAVLRPPHFAVANAVGAAIAQVSGEVDQVYSLQEEGREAALNRARREAVSRAVEAGADPVAVEIVEVEDIPLAYLPSNALRVRVKAVGPLRGEVAA